MTILKNHEMSSRFSYSQLLGMADWIEERSIELQMVVTEKTLDTFLKNHNINMPIEQKGVLRTILKERKIMKTK